MYADDLYMQKRSLDFKVEIIAKYTASNEGK